MTDLDDPYDDLPPVPAGVTVPDEVERWFYDNITAMPTLHAWAHKKVRGYDVPSNPIDYLHGVI